MSENNKSILSIEDVKDVMAEDFIYDIDNVPIDVINWYLIKSISILSVDMLKTEEIYCLLDTLTRILIRCGLFPKDSKTKCEYEIDVSNYSYLELKELLKIIIEKITEIIDHYEQFG